jgi:hypothetical protein
MSSIYNSNPCLFFDPKNPRYLMQENRDRMYDQETVDDDGQSTDHATPKPALRIQPERLSQYLRRFRGLLNNGRYAELIKLLNNMYSKALDGNDLAQAFYRQVNKMLGEESELSHRLQAQPELHRLIDWQLKQLTQSPMQRAAPAPRPCPSPMGG